jgi:16S rRNA processing protein RimM
MALKSVYIKLGHEYQEFKIISTRANKKFLIVKFDGIDSIDTLLPYKGCLLFVKEQTIRENLDEDEFLIDELVGMGVFDNVTGESLGFVIGVSNNGAADLLSVKTNTKHICLIPFVKAIVPNVDIKNKKIIINNIEGLLE